MNKINICYITEDALETLYKNSEEVANYLIKEKDEIELDIDNPDNVYVGISATVPWNFNDSIKNMTNIEFVELIKKYVTKFASQPCIRWWKVEDDLDY